MVRMAGKGGRAGANDKRLRINGEQLRTREPWEAAFDTSLLGTKLKHLLSVSYAPPHNETRFMNLKDLPPHRLFALATLFTVAMLTACGESDEEKASRVERALATQKAAPVQAEAETEKQQQAALARQQAEEATKKLILFAAANLGDPFQSLQASLMEAAVRRLDNCRFQALDAAGSMETQAKQLNEARGQRPAGMVIGAVDAKAVSDTVTTLLREGVFVVGVDERFAPDACSALVFVHQKKLGELAGQQVVEALKRKAADEGKPNVAGRVVHLTGDDTSFEAKARGEGFHEALKAEPGIIIVHEAPGAWTREGGKARTGEALRLQHEFDVVCAQNEAMAQGASEALTTAQAREKVLILGMDGGLDLVRKSIIDVTILQPPPLQTAFSLIRKHLEDSHFSPPASTELQPEAVTPSNLDEVLAKGLRGGK